MNISSNPLPTPGHPAETLIGLGDALIHRAASVPPGDRCREICATEQLLNISAAQPGADQLHGAVRVAIGGGGLELIRDGHIADSENSENYKCLRHFFDRKELSDGAVNSANRKISSRRISSLVHFFSQLFLEEKLGPIKVDPFVKK